MTLSAALSDVISAEIDITIVKGRDLVAKDGSGFLKLGAKKTSDPYVTIHHVKKNARSRPVLGKTEVISKTVNPEWPDATFKIHLEGRSWHPTEPIVLAIYDRDRGSNDDPMGEVLLPMEALADGQVQEKWWPVQNCKGCKDAKGDLLVKVSVLLRKALSLQAKQAYPLPRSTGTVAIGLGWDGTIANAIDLDASCVVVDFRGRILKEECVYYAQLQSRSKAIRHTGDEQEGDEDLGQGDDEIILIDLHRVPSNVCALHFIATVATEGKTFADVKTSKMRLVEWKSGREEARFEPARAGAHTALFFGRLARPSPNEPWTMQAIGASDNTARDWGTLVPEVQMFTRDLVPGLQIDVNARVAIMRKGGLIRVADYCNGRVPSKLTLGLYWDVTDGVNIDLDASVVMLDKNFQQIDLVFFGKLHSSDGSIHHGGDEREGDEKGDDEKVFLHLDRVHPAVAHLFFVINSYSGQELDDVKDAGCHLFDSATGQDLARFEMTNTAFLDKHTALLVGNLFRDAQSGGEWAFEIASLAAQGKTANMNLSQIQDVLKKRPQRALPPPRLPPGGGSFMLRGMNATSAARRLSGGAFELARQASGTLLSAVGIATPAEAPPPMGEPVVMPMQAPPATVVTTQVTTVQYAPNITPAAVPIVQAAPVPISDPTPAPASTTATPLEQLKQLKGMLEMELITQAEFDAKKAELLSRM